jgi:hypothetical protein
MRFRIIHLMMLMTVLVVLLNYGLLLYQMDWLSRIIVVLLTSAAAGLFTVWFVVGKSRP